MLSEQDIDKLLQPIIDREESINLYAIKQIANQIKEIGKLTPSNVNTLQMLYRRGANVREINKAIAKLTTLQVSDIKKLIRNVAQDAYIDTKPYYDYRHKPFIPFDKNKELQKVVTAIANQTAQTYINLSRAQAFMIRDYKHPAVLLPTNLSQTYQSVVDEAIQAVQGGVVDYNTAMRRTLRQLANSGLRRVTYNPESGRTYTQRLDSALRRNLLDGVRAINQGVQDVTGEQFEADGKEITVHLNPAPDHAPVQGHQFSNYEFEKMQQGLSCMDVQGRAYAGFERAIGTLNCRHFTYSIIIGVHKPNYTDDQLQDILNKNEKGYTSPDGEHLTMYECTQRQRHLETSIRYAREGKLAAQAANDTKLLSHYDTKLDKLIEMYKNFSLQCGLSPKWAKTLVN